MLLLRCASLCVSSAASPCCWLFLLLLPPLLLGVLGVLLLLGVDTAEAQGTALNSGRRSSGTGTVDCTACAASASACWCKVRGGVGGWWREGVAARGESALLLPLDELPSVLPWSCASLRDVMEPDREVVLLRSTPSMEMEGRRLDFDDEEPGSALEAELGKRGRIVVKSCLLKLWKLLQRSKPSWLRS